MRLDTKADRENKDIKMLTNDYKLEPEYAAEFKKAEDELAKVILEGGDDVEVAKERLIKKIMNETSLSRDQAAVQVNRLHISGLENLKTTCLTYMPKYINDAIDQAPISKSQNNELKSKSFSNLEKTWKKSSFNRYKNL